MTTGASSRSRLSSFGAHRLQWAVFGLLVIAGFALAGPHGLLGIVSVVAGLGAVVLLLRRGTWLVFIPALGLALPVDQPIPGMQLFDVCAVALAVAGFVATLAAPNRSKWEIRGPGMFAIAVLTIPLLALTVPVVSLHSFLGLYKAYALLVISFLGLRRLISPQQSGLLLWVFPLAGLDTALQLLWKTRGLGALLFARLSFRNFYSRLSWGQSDYISAVLEACICGTVVLALLDRRPVVRFALFASVFVMMQAFLILFSRAGALSLLLFAGVLFFGWRWQRAILFGVTGLVLALVAIATPGGQVFVHRFTSPEEYGSWYFRLVTWEAGLRRFAAHPMTGIGLNQGRYHQDWSGSESANSSILDFLGEQGILGGILFVAIIVTAIQLCVRARPTGLEHPRLVRFAAAGMVAAIVLHSLVEPTITGHVMSVLFVYLLAWLTLQDPRAQPRPKPA